MWVVRAPVAVVCLASQWKGAYEGYQRPVPAAVPVSEPKGVAG